MPPELTKITRNWRVTITPEARKGFEIGDTVFFDENRCLKKAKITAEDMEKEDGSATI